MKTFSRRCSLRHNLCYAAAMLLTLGLGPAKTAAVEPVSVDGPVFPVTRFDIRFRTEDPELPSLYELLNDRFRLGKLETGFVAPRPGVPDAMVRLPGPGQGQWANFHSSAIGSLSAQLVRRLREQGLLGVYVAPDPADIDLEQERDLRQGGDGTLHLLISVARVRELRTVGFGDRLPQDWRVNHAVHRSIRSKSPLQPAESGTPDAADLLRRDVLDDYLFRLNRHPGRRVDAALTPSEDGQGVTLEYRISESRPWFLYAQVSDTGTRETNPWQQRYGVVHRQLTGRDDILSVEYLNAGFDDVNALNASYEAPWFSSRRPAWLRTDRSRSAWLSWLPLDWVPWIGSDRMRFRVSGAWSRSASADVDETDDFLSKEWSVGGRLIYSAWQHGAFFVDIFAGIRARNVESVNQTLQTRPQEYIVLPEIGVGLERNNAVSSLFANVALEGSATGLDRGQAALLGRIDPDRRWLLLHVDGEWSHFLEPLFNRRGWEDPSTAGSSKLAHEISLGLRGQYAFGYRLVPQASQVIGGLFSVRGYPQSEAVGDDVAVATAEYRFHLARSLRVQPRPLKLPFLGDFRAAPQEVYGAADWDLILRAFVDAGLTRRNSRPNGSAERNQTLVGVGAGAELQLLGNLRARFDWARALRSTRGSIDPVRSGHNEFHFLFTAVY